MRARWLVLLVAAVASPTWAAAAGDGEPKPWTLEALQAAAEVADPRVLAAAADLARQRGTEDVARAALWPSIDWTVGATGPVGELHNDPDHLDAVQPGSRLEPGSLNGLGFHGRAGATLTWPLYAFGRKEAAVQAEAQGVAARAEATRAARQLAARGAAQVFWDYQLARRALAVLDDADRQLAGARERLAPLVAQGSPLASKQDLAELDVVHAQVAARRAELVAARDVALEAARTIAGVDPDEPFALAGAPLDPPAVQLAPLAHYADARLESRPEVAAAQAELRRCEALASARRRAALPELVATAYADLNWTPTATRQTNPFAYDPYNQLGTGVGIALRGVLDVARTRGEVEQAEADVAHARAALEDALRAARLEVARAHAGSRAALERAARVRDQEAAARRWLAEAEQAFDAGHTSAHAVLLAAVATTHAAAERLASGRDAQLALADLALASGEDPRTATPGK